MPQLMLVNPAKRRRVKRKANPAKARRRSRRAKNPAPVTTLAARRAMRRRVNPRTRVRRRRNPVSLGGGSSASVTGMLKTAAIGGAGSVAMSVLMGFVGRYLPASLAAGAAREAVQAALAVVVGRGLRRQTRGLSEKMAVGALTVQAANLITPMVARTMPGMIPGSGTMSGMGYYVPNRTVPGTARISPMSRGRMGAYSAGASPLLAAYSRGASPLLSGARNREMVRR